MFKIKTIVFFVIFSMPFFSCIHCGVAIKSIYTAFDGDNLLHIDLMRSKMLRAGKLPINPEHTLGYYVSTYSHHNRKFDVMRDCLALVNASDEFSIFVDGNHKELPIIKLSEGILIEMLYYLRKNNGQATFYWELLDNCHRQRSSQLGKIVLTIDDFKKILGEKFVGIENAYNLMTQEPLPKLVHIIL